MQVLGLKENRLKTLVVTVLEHNDTLLVFSTVTLGSVFEGTSPRVLVVSRESEVLLSRVRPLAQRTVGVQSGNL